MNNECLVLLPIEKMSIGDMYPQGKLPLHCTLMPWFRILEEHLRGLRDKLMSLASSVTEKSIVLVPERQESFGPDKNVPVHVLRQDERLSLLHTEILVFLAERNSLPKELRWVGAGYQPHVTPTGGWSMFGTHHISKHLVLIERGEDANHVVRSSHEFGVPF